MVQLIGLVIIIAIAVSVFKFIGDNASTIGTVSALHNLDSRAHLTWTV
jgi:hypothetical protein